MTASETGAGACEGGCMKLALGGGMGDVEREWGACAFGGAPTTISAEFR